MNKTAKLHIGIDANEANVERRVGSNQYAFEILNRIEQIDTANNFTIFLRSAPLTDLPAERPGWSYRILTNTPLWTQWRLPLHLYTRTPKLNAFLTLGHYAPRISPTPTVITLMDVAFLKYPHFFLKKDTMKLASWTKYSVRQAAHIIAISQNTRQDIIDHYHVSPRRVTVAYPGFDARKFTPANHTARRKVMEKYNLTHPFILYVGTLQPRKNLVRLVKAFENITPQPSPLLAISGKKGWLYDNLVNTINKSPAKDRIRLTGFVPDEDLPPLYSAAKLFVLPGLYEGFGIPPLEALGCGTISVVSSTGALPEVVGDSGICVNPNSTKSIRQGIEKGLQLSDSDRKKRVQSGRKHASAFDWRQSAKKILEVIYDIAV